MRLLFRILRKMVLGPLHRAYIRWDTVTKLESLGFLGAGVTINGPIAFGNPGGTFLDADVSINPHFTCSGSGRLYIGSHTHLGSHVSILTTNHNFEHPKSLPYDEIRINKDVVIGSCVWIGSYVLIVPGVVIGDGAIVAAGSVVSRDVPPLSIVGGGPAKVIRYRDREVYESLVAHNQYLGWPRSYDYISRKKMKLRRKIPRTQQFCPPSAPGVSQSTKQST